MDLFHKTLKDAEKILEQGKYEEAFEILRKHAADEHHFTSDLSNLTRRFATFQQALFETIELTKTHNEKSLEHIKYTRTQLSVIKIILRRLIRDQKIKLE